MESWILRAARGAMLISPDGMQSLSGTLAGLGVGRQRQSLLQMDPRIGFVAQLAVDHTQMVLD